VQCGIGTDALHDEQGYAGVGGHLPQRRPRRLHRIHSVDDGRRPHGQLGSGEAPDDDVGREADRLAGVDPGLVQR